MACRQTRRDVLKAAGLVGMGYWVGARPAWAQSKSANEKLNIAVIGVDGQGGHDMGQMASENIVVLCDVDEKRAAGARQRFSKARYYADFRKVFDQKGIDAVLVATPDHTHAVVSMAAMKAGKHLYCEKPLCHSVHEVKVLMETAKKTGLVTQMGTQMHGSPNYRRVVELVRKQAIGDIKEVHIWIQRAWAAGDRPKENPPVPEGLHYDLWLGPAPERPYNPAWVPQNWRSWWDFGGGTLGDMGCHYFDLPYWALELSHPTAIEAKGPPVHPDGCPDWMEVRYEYRKSNQSQPLAVVWHHGGKTPDAFSQAGVPKWDGDRALFIGTEGMILSNYDRHVLLPEDKFRDFKKPEPFIPDSIGHYKEFIEACKGRGKTLCHFGYAGPMTQAVLLGNVAYRSGRRLEWDGEAQKVTNTKEADKFLARKYREGWEL